MLIFVRSCKISDDSYENRHNHYNSSNDKESRENFGKNSDGNTSNKSQLDSIKEVEAAEGHGIDEKSLEKDIDSDHVEKKKGFISRLFGLCCLATD